MRIIGLQAENIKNLKAIQIKPKKGQAVMLRGNNGAGKSATIECLFIGLTGKKIDEPIRKGQTRATIKIDTEKYIIKKLITAKGDYLDVTTTEGIKQTSPQKLLNKLFDARTIDPVAFANEKPAEQRRVLMQLADLDFTEADQKRQELFEQRTMVNRQVRDAKGTLEGMEIPEADTPEQEISISEAIATLDNIKQERSQAAQWQACKATYEDEIASLEERLAQVQALLKNRKQALKDHMKNQVAPPSDDELARAQSVVEKAEGINQAIRAAANYRAQRSQLDKFEAESAKLTAQIEKLDKTKQTKIEKAKYPIKGLAVDDQQVLYNGLPLSQMSSGEQVRVSTAVAMALNPELRVLCVREGSLLDDDGIAAIAAQAKDKDVQLWIEIVGEEGPGILIRDGEIAKTSE